MFKNYNITLDTIRESKNQLLNVNTNDLSSLNISMIIAQHGKPMDLTGTAARIAILKPDKKTVLQDCIIADAKNGKCEVVLDTQAYILQGQHYAELMIYKGETVAVTSRFVYRANRGILNDGTIESTNEWQSINKAIADAEGVLDDLRKNGTGVDAQARRDIEDATRKLAEKAKHEDLLLKREKSIPIGLDDAASDLLTAINGGTPVNVLSIPRPSSVTPETISFMTIGKNLHNKQTDSIGRTIDYTTGELLESSSYNTTYFIPVTPSANYVASGAATRLRSVAFYDKERKFISGLDRTSNPVITPVNAAYMRLSYSTGNIDTYQVEEGTVITDYHPYKATIPKQYTEKHDFNVDEDVAEKSISIDKTDFIEIGLNKFNKATAIKGYFINYTTGESDPNPDYYVSDFIVVNTNSNYIDNIGYHVAFYDENKVFISGLDRDHPQPYQTPANAKYMRVSIRVSRLSVDDAMVQEGSTLSYYQPFGYVMPKLLKETPSNNVSVPLDVVMPKKLYGIVNDPVEYFYENFIIAYNPLVNVMVSANNGDKLETRYSWESPTSPTNFDLTITLKDMELKEVIKKTSNLEIVDKSKTNQVNLLAIGDSITRRGQYVQSVVEKLPNVNTVGTRQYEGEDFAREGRGGWRLDTYMERIGHTDGDSPFLFPVGVPGHKYWGNTEFWRKTCYTDPQGYDFEGFQRIAKSWDGEEFLFNVSGYPKQPSIDDVVVDPTKPSNERFLKYNGSSWVAMSPQPQIEFSFSKYMERYSSAFGGTSPNVVSFLLGTNDFFSVTQVNAGDFINNLNNVIESIKSYDNAIKIIINLPIRGGDQSRFKNQSQNSIQFNRNMQELGLALIGEFDNEAYLQRQVYICNMNMTLDKELLNDHVHPGNRGQEQIALSLAGLIQKIR